MDNYQKLEKIGEGESDLSLNPGSHPRRHLQVKSLFSMETDQPLRHVRCRLQGSGPGQRRTNRRFEEDSSGGRGRRSA